MSHNCVNTTFGSGLSAHQRLCKVQLGNHRKAGILLLMGFLHSAGYYATPNEMFYIDQVQKLPCHILRILVINLVYSFKTL